METLVFRYRLYFGKEINRKRWVDEDVNLPVFLVDEDVNLPVFLVDEDVNHPEERHPQRSMLTRVVSLIQFRTAFWKIFFS